MRLITHHQSAHLGAAGAGVSLRTESYLISPASCSGHTPLQCVCVQVIKHQGLLPAIPADFGFCSLVDKS